MLVLHAHWQPMRRPVDNGGILFWAETSDVHLPSIWRNRVQQKSQNRDHPYCLSPENLRLQIGIGTPLGKARNEIAYLRLPTGRSGPIPSPDLGNDWDIDEEQRMHLAPWLVNGLWLPPDKALGVLVSLPEQSPVFVLAEDAKFWRKAADLVLETLSSQKILPTMMQVNEKGGLQWDTTVNGHTISGTVTYQARWLAVLDGPNDNQRLAKLAAAMPLVCRAEIPYPPKGKVTGGFEPAAGLLDSFIKTTCDSLMRSWGRAAAPRLGGRSDDPVEAWVMALFTDDATVKAPAGQLNALYSSLRAWMRYLNVAGDAAFRIAFVLESPPAGEKPSGEAVWNLRYFLQARDDPSLLVPADEVWRKGGNGLRTLGRRFEQPQEKLLAGLGYSARLFPAILPSLQNHHPTGISLSTQDAYTFLRQAGPLLEQAGFSLIVPPWWNQNNARLGVRLHVRPLTDKQPQVISGGKLNLQNLVQYQWELAIGETLLTRQEFEALVALKEPLVQIRGQWVQLDPEQIEAAIHFWESQKQHGQFSLLQIAQFGLGGKTPDGGLPLTEVVAEGWVEDWYSRLAQSDRLTELSQPATLHGQLRPYQIYGFSWLAFFRRWGLGAILADDMGLGKTVEALALLLHEQEEQGQLPGPVLLVCPTSVVTNWQRESLRFAPSLKVKIHQGPSRLRNDEFINTAQNYDLVLTSYAVARQDADTLGMVQWYGVILDEAQNIKNPSAKQTRAVRNLPAGFRLALTGTPVENRLSELWSIMQFLNPDFLGSQQSFQNQFAIPIERFGDKEATQTLKKLISPFILRRVKSDPNVIQDLPEKIEMKEYCNLTEEQATLYGALVQQTLKRIETTDGIERKGLVLTLLMQLKQICNHPAHYLKQSSTSDLDLISGRSGKLVRLTEMLEEVLAEGDHALIFTQFAEMGKLLAAYLPAALNTQTLFLHGGTPVNQRDIMVRRFQEEPRSPQIFILSLKAGGLGLNLTRANHVFHFDRWWNPAVEDQATDRAFRIGQKRNVQVHKFVTVGSLEERIDELIESKKSLAESIIGGGEDWLTELTTDELRDLVSLRRVD
jgi:SNF2 family DNA or RNA helicase